MSNLNWKGDEVLKTTKENGAAIISEFALTVEGEAKRELRKGHGVETGTARRSIHTALPGYDWSGDDVAPSASSVERGGEAVMPEASDQITVEVGSGLGYALALHQGHHNFSGYHYLTNGLSKAREKLDSIIARHQVKR
jgi:hypothetical protein